MSNMQLVKNFVADVAIPAYRIVKPGSADDRVTLCSSTGDSMIGVTMEVGAAAGERCDVQLAEIAFIEAGALIVRGALITSDGVGRAVTASPAAGVNMAVIGRALESASAAGDIINVMQSIGQIQG